MLREIVQIDESLCNGCGVCVPNCHEGALQIIDGKARLISDLMCDGLGACLGHCPEGAITIEEREAEAYDETEVIKGMVSKGKNTVAAHLKHLREHNEVAFLKEGMTYLKNNREQLGFSLEDVIDQVHENKPKSESTCATGGCPGSQTQTFSSQGFQMAPQVQRQPSQLTHWPVQLHLINPMAAHFQKADLLVAADCSAFSVGNFHEKWLKDKTLVIACPKLDSGTESYINKLAMLIDDAKVNTITVMMMEVPCCGGLINMVREAKQMTSRNVPIKAIVMSIKGDMLSEEWI